MILYLPGVIPREKYSPLLLVFRLYFCPLSRLSYSTTPPAIGLPSASLQTPFTVPDACAKTGEAHSPSARTTIPIIAKCFFIVCLPAKYFLRMNVGADGGLECLT